MTPLEDLLQQCTVKITVPGGWGTGFFVAPGLILTCAHVVRKAADLQVTVSYPAWRQPLSAIVKAQADDRKTLDLALVELSEPLPDHPCVLLDEEPVAIGQALYSYGYLESYTNAAPVRPVNEGLTGDTPPLLKLQGAQVEKGISGAALLNLKTGKVCGMVKETRAAGFDLGGGAIPTRVILEQFPELRELQQAFHGGDRRWRDRVASAAATSQTVSQTSSQINSGGTNYQTQTGTNNINYIGETHIYTYSASLPDDPDDHVAADELQRYLQAVAIHYEKWWEVYTLMDAESRAQKKQKAAPLFDFGLMVEPLALKDEIEQDNIPDAQAEIERFPVLEGLQKYLFQEHVLLVGRPGSGKSTTLARLMFELAKDDQIPILVELRLYESSILELIRLSCKRHSLNLKATQIEMLLDNRKLILLVDGVNELPLKFEKNLLNFRHNYPEVPIVFTTRDAELYGGLGIERKLEIQPLTEPQMRSFVQKYLSKQADKMLRQLKDRLQEFGTTPLLLWLLCSLFDETKQIPQNLGEMFRLFTNSYEKKIKRDIVPEVDRRLWRSLLKQLAATMIQNDKPAISQTEACEVFADNLKALEAKDPLVSNKALDDLLNYHLIQRNGDLIEFRHQLIQEYYAAEWLLDEIETLDGKTLDCNYLNYLKWTEPLALMLSLMEDKDEAKALWVVERALAVDLMLGARLAGEVRSKKLQRSMARSTIKTIQYLINYPDGKKVLDIGFEIYLLSLTKSRMVLDEIIPKKKNRYNNKKSKIALASVMDKFGEPAIYALRDLENDDDSQVRRLYARSLGNIPSEESIERLLTLLKDSDFTVKARAMLSLSNLLVEMKSKDHDYLTRFYSELDLLLTIKDLDIYKLGIIAFAKLTIGLGQEHPECLNKFFSRINSILKDSEPKKRILGVITLSRITIHLSKDFPECLDQFFARIDSILKDSDLDVYNQAVISLVKISLDLGKDFPERTNEFFSRIDFILLEESNLSRVTKDSYTYVIIKLRELGSPQAIEKMGEFLSIRTPYFGRIAAENLGDIRSEDSLNQLIKALDSPSYRIRKHAVQGLFFAGSEQKQPYLKNAINGLTKIIKDSHKHIPRRSQLRNLAVTVLVNIGSEITIDDLVEILRDQEFINLHVKIVEYLGKFYSSKSKELLIELGLLHSNMSVRRKSFFALRKLIGEEELLEILKIKNCDNEFSDILYPVLGEGEVLKNKSKYDVSQVIDEIIDKSYQLDVLDGVIYAREIRGRLQEIERENVEFSDLVEKMPDLKNAWIETGVIGIKRILRAIQSECKFYDYEIWQEAKAIQNSKLEMQDEKHSSVFQQLPEAIYVNGILQIIEQNHGNVIGKQSPEQQ